MHMNPVGVDDIVKIAEGPLKGKQATVQHVYRGHLFGKCRTTTENNGFICVRTRACVVHGGK
eukprot:2937900-Pyramimonas_sp.AAC.1